MKTPTLTLVLACFPALVRAQQIGTFTPEVHPSLPSQTCKRLGCTTQSTKVVLDANWRWLHKVNDYAGCVNGNTWSCSDPATCATTCALDGVDYAGTYGVTTSGNALTLKFVTNGQYGQNVGSRVYLLQDDSKYQVFKLLNREFSFDVDVSRLPCGLNGALYFVQMDADGGKSRFMTNQAGAAYGTGYCDAQCPRDLRFVNGKANILDWTGSQGRYGSCCAEIDIWEANSASQAFTSHPCTVDSAFMCSGDTQCGTGTQNRYSGVCDRDGCDFNPFRLGATDFYGAGANFAIDTTKPFTVVTQFITHDNTDNGNLVAIRRSYKQGNKPIVNAMTKVSGVTGTNCMSDAFCSQTKKAFNSTDDHTAKGGLTKLGEALKRGVVLTMSIWADNAAHMLWLDSTYPADAQRGPGVQRGTCATSSGNPTDLVAQYPDAYVKFFNIKVGELGSIH